MLATLLVIAVLAVGTGCASSQPTVSVFPGTDFGTIRKVFVVQSTTDKREVVKLIVANLERRGFEVTSGSGETIPQGTDMLVEYTDRWMWDITVYMTHLTVFFRTPDTKFPIASGHSHRGTLARKSAEGMVDEVLSKMLEGRKS